MTGKTITGSVFIWAVVKPIHKDHEVYSIIASNQLVSVDFQYDPEEMMLEAGLLSPEEPKILFDHEDITLEEAENEVIDYCREMSLKVAAGYKPKAKKGAVK